MDLGLLAQYGAIGIFAALMYILFKQSSQREQERSDATITREQERSDRLDKRIEDLTNYYNTTVIPALERSTTATTSAIEFLTELQEQRKIEDEIDRRERRKERGLE